MAKAAAALVEKQDRGAEIGLGRGFDRGQVARENGVQVGALCELRRELAVPPVERLFELDRKCQDQPLQDPCNDFDPPATRSGLH